VKQQTLGRWGEEQAAAYLESQGYRVIQRNVRTPYGEIDLIARQAGNIVFIEVKSRRDRKFSYPEAAVNIPKQARFRAAADYYLQGISEGDLNPRIDVIAVEKQGSLQAIKIHHFENAF
jgi:putative endonuclease